MTKFILTATVTMGLAGVLAPISACADAGTSMYSPSPIVVHNLRKNNISGATGRVVHAEQIKAIRND